MGQADTTEADPTLASEVDLSALAPRVEAALLTSDRAMTAGRLAEALDLPGSAPVKAAIETLNAAYESTGRSFRIEEVAGGYSVMTLPQYADVLLALKRGKNSSRLSPAALETLSIIAYKQPVLRADGWSGTWSRSPAAPKRSAGRCFTVRPSSFWKSSGWRT